RRDLEKRIVECGVSSREPRDDDLSDPLAHGEGGEQRIDGRRGHRGRGTRDGLSRATDRLAAGTAEHRRKNQESMRPHSLSLLLGLVYAAPAAAQVRPGIEVLLSDSIGLVAGKRVALLTNQTGVNRLGQRDIDLVRGTPGVRLLVILSPEHGLRGTEDRPGLPDAVDSASGLPIYSLYGGTPLSAIAALDSVDVVLVDLQDIGARYYSYPTTAVLLLQEAARRGKPLVVLDRPNPIGGVAVQGTVPAVVRPVERVGDFLPVPMRHGMTLGEVVRLANDWLDLHARLTVVPAAGWRRAMYYDDTGLPWVRPSPNMPDLESALHYSGICLFEGTNLSVGRGTATRCASTRRASTGWPRVTSCVARSSAPAPRTPCGAAGSRRSRGFAGCAPSTCSIETPPPSRYFPPAMIVIPQKVRDGFGNLLDPLALRLIRLHVRPNFITIIGTLVIVASAVAFALGRARWGGLLLLLSGLCDMVDGRVARRGGMVTTFGAFFDSTLDRVGEAALFSGIAIYFVRGGVAPAPAMPRPPRVHETLPGHAPALQTRKGS